MKKLILVVLATALAGCATVPVQPTVAAANNKTKTASAKDVTIAHESVTKVCIYSGRVVTIAPNGKQSYL